MKTTRIIAMSALLLAINCKPDEPQPTNMIVNGDVERGSSAPNNWLFSGSTGQTGKWTNEAFLSPGKSLKISGDVASPNYGGFWAQQNCSNIPHGKKLVLKAMVKGNLTGVGISVVLRGDASSKVVQFITTEGRVAITGSFDWKEYSVELPKVDDSISCVWIFLTYLNNTTGEVYFDDITLEYL